MATSSSTKNNHPPQEQKQWAISDFSIGRKLAAGKFGRVYLAKLKERRMPSEYLVAIKVIHKQAFVELSSASCLQNEVRILSNLRHPSIVRLYQFFHDNQYCYLVEEYCAGGELWALLNENGRFEEPTVSQWILQLTDALIYIHGKHILHRDIKPENLLLDHENNLKLADFGWSTHTEPAEIRENQKRNKKEPQPGNFQNQQTIRRRTFCGTNQYLAPEMFDDDYFYGEGVDIWAVGILAFELLTGAVPFDQAKKIENGDFNYSWKGCMAEHQNSGSVRISSEAQDFISRFLQKNPNHRIKLKHVVGTAFVLKHYHSTLKNVRFYGIDIDEQKANAFRSMMARKNKTVFAIESHSNSNQSQSPNVYVHQKPKRRDVHPQGKRAKTAKIDVRWEPIINKLMQMKFSRNYIKRAITVAQKQNKSAQQISLTEMTEIIQKLHNLDARRKEKSATFIDLTKSLTP